MLLDGRASLFVIYNDDLPFSISVNFISEDTLFADFTVFDIDYSKFNIGFIDIMKHLQWCIDNKIKVLDFSKGGYEYKKRWSNLTYHFNYHILYDSNSLKAIFVAKSVSMILKTVQFLRDKNIHTLYHIITDKIYRFNSKKQYKNSLYKTEEIDIIPKNINLVKFDFKTISCDYFKRITYTFLYKYCENIKNITVFKIYDDAQNAYIISGKSKHQKLIFDKEYKLSTYDS